MLDICAKRTLLLCAIVAIGAALAVLMLLWSSAGLVSAHGGGFQLNKSASAGPYNLTIGSIPDPPTVGEAIFIIEVTHPDTDDRITGLDVRIVTSGPEASDAESNILYGIADSYDPTLYETRAELPIAGPWKLDVLITGQAGSGEAQFTYDVKQVSPVGGIIALLTLLAFLAVIGLSMRAFLKERSRGRLVRRRKAQA